MKKAFFRSVGAFILRVLLPFAAFISCKGGAVEQPGFDTDAGLHPQDKDASLPGKDSGHPDATAGRDTGTGARDAAGFDAGSGPDVTVLPDIENPPVCGSLPERLTVVSVDVSPATIALGDNGPWSNNRPIIISAIEDGSSKVGWTDYENQVHVTPLDAAGRRSGSDLLTAGMELRGFTAHPDGAAVLLRRDDVMALVRLDNAGAVVFDKPLVGGEPHDVEGAKWIDSWSHEGRLAWSGSEYAAYFGHTGNWGANGNHQGDILQMRDASGNATGWGWGWGCSHSLDVRLSRNDAAFGPVCLSDCYPGKGIYFNHYSMVFDDQSGNCGGYINSTLGGLVPWQGGFFLTFASPVNRASSDVALVFISNDGAPGEVKWLTDTPGVQEAGAHLAQYGDNLLAAWTAGADRLAAVIDANGNVLEGPAPISAYFAERDDFINFPNGDVGWAFAWDNMSELKIVRLRLCR